MATLLDVQALLEQKAKELADNGYYLNYKSTYIYTSILLYTFNFVNLFKKRTMKQLMKKQQLIKKYCLIHNNTFKVV